MPIHWAVATCLLANPYAGQRDRPGHSIARRAFAPIYGKGSTPEAAEADCRKWLAKRIEQFRDQSASKYAPLTIGTPDDWKVEPFIMPVPKFRPGQKVMKVRGHDGKTIPAAKREIKVVRFNADHPNSVGLFCAHIDNVAGLGFAFMESEKDFEAVTASRKRC